MAQAIVTAAAGRKLAVVDTESFDSVTGKGITATVGGRRVLVGNEGLLMDEAVDTTSLVEAATGLASDGKTAMFVAVDGAPPTRRERASADTCGAAAGGRISHARTHGDRPGVRHDRHHRADDTDGHRRRCSRHIHHAAAVSDAAGAVDDDKARHNCRLQYAAR